jgi:phosphatidylinositol alpha-mannosyltransferase
VVLFCARHEKRKGLDVLVEAFADIARREIPMRLWVAGVGPDTEALRHRASVDPALRRRIEWLGRISDEEKFARLRRADVFCAPSLGGESFGVVLVEAMAAESVVVASSLDGYRNVATDGRDAVLVEPGDARALADVLVAVTSDDALAAHLRRNGARRAEDFAMTRLADLYLERYAAVRSTTRS